MNAPFRVRSSARHCAPARIFIRYSVVVLFLILNSAFFIPTPTLAAACDCVCTGCSAPLSATVSNQGACDLYCGGGINGCSGGTCTEQGSAVTPSVPAGPDTGAQAVRDKLNNIAERGIGLPTVSAATLAGRIVRAALVLLGVIFLVLTIFGGSLYLTAGGNEEQVKKAKSVLIRAAIGLVIVLFAGAVTQFITGYINRGVVVH